MTVATPLSPKAGVDKPEPARRVPQSGQSRIARGESHLWLCGGALGVSILMIVGLLVFVFGQGLSTFWPGALIQVKTVDDRVFLGEFWREETYKPSPELMASLPPAIRSRAEQELAAAGGESRRLQLRTGNFDLTNVHFTWIPEFMVEERTEPADAMLLERRAWGRFYGYPRSYRVDGAVVATGSEEINKALATALPIVQDRFEEATQLRKRGSLLAKRQEKARLEVRAQELAYGVGSDQAAAAQQDYENVVADCARQVEEYVSELRGLEDENARHELVMATADGVELAVPLGEIVRAYRPNDVGLGEKLALYLSRWGEFLFDEPRNSNSEGGVYPAIFGTVLMTLLMTLFVLPFGVLAALYLREYAKAGLIISAVRIAVNNLAGVPSIVFGVFGLGFFCYLMGGSIDSIFFPERLPSPTYGKGTLMWASLTLALLTLPVVIVATEEALAAVPSSMREGSYACGASKWQTIRRIVLPRAMPGIMTGAILAMARGAGEVAPLMLVGAVKMAPELPLDQVAPFVHPERSFMHLGYHIYDLGFHSQDSEGNKPMVYTTTLLLIGIILLLNVAAIWLRSRLRRRFVGAQF